MLKIFFKKIFFNKLKVSFEEGSLILKMSPYHDYPTLYPTEGLPQQEIVFFKLRELLTFLQDEKEDYRSKVENLIPEHRVRFTIFNYLNELLPKDNFKASITFFDSPKKTTTIELTKRIFKNRVSILLREEGRKD